MAAKADGLEAVQYKSWLELKAGLTSDAGERQALMEEADRLRKQAAELQKGPLISPRLARQTRQASIFEKRQAPR